MTDMRLCWSCEHFNFESGSPGYSEYTPGYDAEFWCAKEVFETVRMGDLADGDDLRKLLETASGCLKFMPRLSPEQREKYRQEERAKYEAEEAKKVSPFNWDKSAEEIGKVERVFKVGRQTWNRMALHLHGRHTPEAVREMLFEMLGYYPEPGEYRVEITEDGGKV